MIRIDNHMNLRRLTGRDLKWFAIVTMVIDHTGAFLLEPAMVTGLVSNQFSGLNIVLRLIGRLSFPLFTFLLVEGFVHTRNIKRYLAQLGVFALVSEIPFDLAKEGMLFDFTYQNIFFTLFIGLLTITLFDRFKAAQYLKWVILVTGMILAKVLQTDYAAFGILLIFVFYYFRENKIVGNIVVSLLLFLQTTAILALIPIRLYNNKRGKQKKYFFYLFYPIHLLLFFIIRVSLFK